MSTKTHSCHSPRHLDQRSHPTARSRPSSRSRSRSCAICLTPHFPYRIGRSTKIASNFILASLFYEPSTRTRLSFESAMLRLGGETITSADPATSSAAKGESLADSVRVIANYADIMVIRHPRDGAARLAAEYSPIPVINGGDGSHEHPTQTLCDLFLLKKKNKRLKNLKVAISGDLRGSRTIHSFVYALARFGATIMPMAGQGHGAAGARRPAAARGIPLPDGVRPRAKATTPHRRALCDARKSRTSSRCSPAPSSRPISTRSTRRSTRSMSPASRRSAGPTRSSPIPKIDRKFLNEPKYSDASVMHPLPRVGELDASFDADRRAVYFEQAAYGVPVRMALIALLLGLKGKSLHKFDRRLRAPQISALRPAAPYRHPLRQQELHRARPDGNASTYATSSMW